jgi:hypothetical protein
VNPNYCIHQPGRAASAPEGSRPGWARPAGDACVSFDAMPGDGLPGPAWEDGE